VSESVAAAIRDAIKDHGPIAFDEFMEHALYGPGGFYERPPIGPEGHFLTSPHVHPVFAELLLRAISDLWANLGRPQPLTLVEVGAGDGTLARHLVRLAEERELPLAYTAVERSPGARERLRELGLNVLPGLPGELDRALVLANELLDNLPFRRVRATEAGLVEVRVGARRKAMVEVEIPVATPADEGLAAAGLELHPGQEATVPVGAFGFVDEMAKVLRSGYLLLIDYGSTEGAPAGEVHGYRSHRVLDDVLADPGESDITAGVDIGAISRRAVRAGIQTQGWIMQRDALIELGFADWNEQQRERQRSLVGTDAASDAVRIWEGRSRASLLVDPQGLGRLWWLLLATPGLPSPTWLSSA
jgi:NADH dehydrogenase [ubiquinone] 1 alpha subcomplex assembly factor 7